MQAVKGKLVHRKNDLWQELIDVLEKDAGEGYQDLIQSMRDEGNGALAELRGSAAFSLLKLKVQELDTIEQALKRIEKGTYGHCMDCGSWISAARLQIMPHAVRCRTCQEKWERAHRR
ncbi:MAG: TraR/DksA family transcriptional regulator [Deltaproteobacteria bacterium]|nr:TraR/DksA family transcriptional regulator [Deltaproteobacteria bacterium]MBW2078149.1 TraR/DksA family transcriptional regulator [Deltaproteobacteria bacterium]MBW2312184.1 TraR/DksA family transcriptional regulator [Deltaproteobacteria bacterium]